MTRQKLAQELRKRQCDLGIVPKDDIDLLSDDQIIECYLFDAETGQRLIPADEVDFVIASAYNSYAFTHTLNDAIKQLRDN
jgi:hypothetical protein